MHACTHDQTCRRDELQCELERMNPKSGLRRQLLDLFYTAGTRWTWHTVLGLVLIGLPYACILCLCGCLAAVLCLPALAVASLLDTFEDVLGWFSRLAFNRYRRVLQAHDALSSTGTTDA